MNELTRNIIAVGLGIGLAFSIDSTIHQSSDHRAAYPVGLVCEVTLPPGAGPKALAKNSLFKASAATVIQRSQFMDPEALLKYADGDTKDFATDDVFNVQLKENHIPRPTDKPYFESDYEKRERWRNENCTYDEDQRSLVSSFPSIAAATRILKSTVAVSESTAREGELIANRRCGAIAIGPNRLLTTAPDYASGDNQCTALKSNAQVFDQHLTITADQQSGGLRTLTVGDAELNNVEIAADYVPAPGDNLIYSGFSASGTRQYFRVQVAGDKGGQLLLRAGVDQTFPDSDQYGRDATKLQGGSGGLFTFEGKLVALTEETATFKNLSNVGDYTPAYEQSLGEYNHWLQGQLTDFGTSAFTSGTTAQVTAELSQQFVFAYKLSANDASRALPASTPRG